MKNLIMTFAIVPFLVGCMKEEDLSSSSLEGGTWKTSCTYTGSSSVYAINTASFSVGSFNQTSTAYGAGCSSAVVKMEATGTYVIGGKTAASSAIELDMKLATLTLTPMNSSLVTSYNNVAYCGYSDWALGVTKDVAGRTCDGTVQSAAGEMAYDIYYINPYDVPELGWVKGTLNFGYNDTSHDGSTPAKRPTSLASSYAYSRN